MDFELEPSGREPWYNKCTGMLARTSVHTANEIWPHWEPFYPANYK